MADENNYRRKSARLDPKNQEENSSKLYNQFICKSLIVSVCFVVVPIIHSQAPEFINNTSWEFLQFIFVGIAVAYGLFSKKNEEETADKDNYGSKFDNAQSYVSKLLHVSSVFDDEIENPSASDDISKVQQTWSCQYYRGDSMVVVAKESPLGEKTSSQMDVKPLLLPVRSLKQRVTDSNTNTIDSNQYITRPTCTKSGGSNRFCDNIMHLAGENEENVVLRSPIPWRSRSGKNLESKEDGPLFSLSPSQIEEEEDSHIYPLHSHSLAFKSNISHSSTSNSSSSSSSPLKNLSPCHSFSSKIQDDDFSRKKISYHKSPPPPPPPPTPPPFQRKPPLRNSSFSGKYNEFFPSKEFKRSGRSVPEESSWSETEETGGFHGKRNQRAELVSMERRRGDILVLNDDDSTPLATHRRTSVFPVLNDDDSTPLATHRRRSVFSVEEKKDFVQDYQDSESEEEEEDEEEEDDEDDEFKEKQENEMILTNKVGDSGPDVDKKADEFIAKFREQIRLQRIASIRKSTGQIAKTSVR